MKAAAAALHMAASTLRLLLVLVLVLVSGGSSGSHIPSQITGTPGQDITLPCQATGSQAIKLVEWSRNDLDSELVFLYENGKVNQDHQHPIFKNRVDLMDGQMKNGNVSLVLKNVMTAHTGTYECKILHPKSRTSILKAPSICIINLIVASRSRILLGNKEEDLRNGGNEAGSPGLLIGLTVYLHLSVRFLFCDF